MAKASSEQRSTTNHSSLGAANFTRHSQPILFLILGLLLRPLIAVADEQPGVGDLSTILQDSTRGFHIGDTCRDSCSSVIEHSYCNNVTNTCQCLDTHPIEIDGVTCVEPKNLFESCTYNQQCSNRNEQAICQQYEQRTRCSCRKGFREEKAHEIPIRYECVLGTYSKMSLSQNF